ncbi:VOC family protein [Priestia megaterium]|nr:VOC family protein [Priestia megaterium]
MIKSIVETHIKVSNLENSISFYEKLGLKLAHVIEEKRRAFFFLGKEKNMLGIREVPQGEVIRDHFALGVNINDLEKSISWLKSNNFLVSKTFFGKEPSEPIVHAWMPAASVYFEDPDGHSLEFIAILEDEPIPTNEIFYLSEWRKMQKNTE